jgi:hypothetical protein
MARCCPRRYLLPPRQCARLPVSHLLGKFHRVTGDKYLSSQASGFERECEFERQWQRCQGIRIFNCFTVKWCHFQQWSRKGHDVWYVCRRFLPSRYFLAVILWCGIEMDWDCDILGCIIRSNAGNGIFQAKVRIQSTKQMQQYLMLQYRKYFLAKVPTESPEKCPIPYMMTFQLRKQ